MPTKSTLLAFVLACAPLVAEAHPYDRFAGQTNPYSNVVCNPAGSTSEMAACGGVYVHTEETALAGVEQRLLAKAREEDARLGAIGVRDVDTFQQAQDAWRAWRDQECRLATIDSAGGSMQRIAIPRCIGDMTAARRQSLERLLELWNSEWRVDGEYVGTQGYLDPR